MVPSTIDALPPTLRRRPITHHPPPTTHPVRSIKLWLYLPTYQTKKQTTNPYHPLLAPTP